LTEVNDKPVATCDSNTLAEYAAATTINVVGNDSTWPANESGQTLKVTAVGAAAHGAVAITNGGADLSYTPAANYNGPDSFTYTVTDNGTTNGVGEPKSDTATVTVTVTEVNDAPAVTAGPAKTVDEGSSVTISATFSDADQGEGQAYTYVVEWGDGSTQAAQPATGGAVTATHTYADNLAGNAPYNAVVRVADDGTTAGHADVKNGQATVAVTVKNVAPVVNTVTMSGIDPVTGTATLTAAFADPGADSFATSGFTATSGTSSLTPGPLAVNEPARTMTATVKLPRGCATYAVTATVVDDDGGTGAKSVSSGGTDVYQVSFKDPIRDNERNIAKYGNVVPVKVLLSSSCTGAAVTTVSLHLTVVEGNITDDAVDDSPNVVVESVSNADSGTQMRVSGGMYLYNLSTKGLKQATDYTLRVRSGSSTGPVILKALLQPKK
jgi:hypothetical protein